MTNPKILVTSAAGNTGTPATLQLLEKGFPVRAFVRSDDHRAKRLRDAGAEIFVGNQYSIADMRRAMDGVQRAYHCAPTAPNGLHFGTVFAIAAQEAKLEHVVMLAQWLSDPDHPSMMTREVWLNEEVLKLLPDTTLTVNNVGWFAENYFMGVLEPVAQLGILPMPLGDGNVKKNAPPSNDDIAAVTVAALIDPAAHAGKIYRPTGPELLSPNEIAAIMGKVLKRKVKYMDVPEAMMLKALKVAGFAEAMPTQLRLYADEYRRGTFAVHAPNKVVRELAGREPEDFETIVRRVVATRPEAVQTLGNKLKAFRNFMKILATPKIDPEAIERRRDHVLLESPTFVRDSQAWREKHDPDAGYIPDRSGSEDNPVSLVREMRA
ncbi:MAG: NmrA family NAD(P)-binding protein [Proteobacteria bacterium]|nr:NmrA family NAD(P)-binding protein [Pseudomonadota bacterium]